MRSKIVITSDFEALKEEILGLYGRRKFNYFKFNAAKFAFLPSNLRAAD